MAEQRLLKVREAAGGLSVRALHHYDQIGLAGPSERTGAGHRLYAERDVARLEQVAALRRVSFATPIRLADGRDYSR